MLDILTHVLKIMECDKDRCRLAMTCNRLMNSDFYFDNLIDIEKITDSRLFDNFTNIYLINNISKLPRMVTHLTFPTKFCKSIKYMIPHTVKNITFNQPRPYNNHHYTLYDIYFACSNCNATVSDYIPSSVTSITINGYYDDDKQNEISKILGQDNPITFIYPNL